MDHNHGNSRFQPGNKDLARRYWYIIAGFVGGFAVCRIINLYKALVRYVALPSLQNHLLTIDIHDPAYDAKPQPQSNFRQDQATYFYQPGPRQQPSHAKLPTPNSTSPSVRCHGSHLPP